jgi:LysR family transcriptional regulator, mexEF-oprN operon transcriptional activator
MCVDTRCGRHRWRIASTTHFAGAVLRLATPAALATLPTHAATAYADALGPATSAPPLPMPSCTVSSIWHRTLTGEPDRVWLRRLVGKAADGNQPAVTSILAKAGNQGHRVRRLRDKHSS